MSPEQKEAFAKELVQEERLGLVRAECLKMWREQQGQLWDQMVWNVLKGTIAPKRGV